MAGQINRGWPMGDALYQIASKPEVRNVLEIGTWRGDGSTAVLAQALAETGGKLWTLEAKEQPHRHACELYRDSGLPVELLHGASIDPAKYPPFSHYWPRIETTSQERLEPGSYRDMYNDEIVSAWAAPRHGLLSRLIREVGSFDLVLLDGGEFASGLEFELLEPHIAGYVFMDDTNHERCIKNALPRQQVVQSSGWRVVADELGQRYGWLAAKRA
jgi:hypothetical protein